MIRSMVLKSWGGILSLFLFAGPGFTETYHIDPSHSSVEFSVRHIFSQVSGKFKTFSGVIRYDPKSLENASVEATIKVASIDTDNEKRDNHLKSPDFFDAKKYPEITFKSESVKNQEGGLLLKGDLTMHGVTKSVLVLVEVLGVGTHPMSKIPVAGFSAGSTLKRSDFGVNSWTDPANIVGDEVKITLNLEALAKPMTNPCNQRNPCGKTENPCNPCNPCK